jgi:hypothetical protein
MPEGKGWPPADWQVPDVSLGLLPFANGIARFSWPDRRWALKFGTLYESKLRRQRHVRLVAGTSTRSSPSAEGGCICGLREDEGEVLNILIQRKRDKRSALKLTRKLLKKRGFAPENWITDKLPSYGAALHWLGASRCHVTGGRLTSRAENSHHRCDSGRDACSALSRRNRRSNFSQPTPSSTTPAMSNAT